MYEDLCIITPTLNEKENIEKFILSCKRLYPKAKIIVSDDGSKDGTDEIVLKYKEVVFLDRRDEREYGLTISVIDAIGKCDRKYFIVIDADMQHPIDKIKDIYDKFKESDVVVGRRTMIVGDWPFFRKLMSKIAVLLGRARLVLKKYKVKDVVSGFFGMKTNLAKEVLSSYYYQFELRGYKILFDFLKYLPKETKVNEIDYVFDIRKGGESKIGMKAIISYFKSLFK